MCCAACCLFVSATAELMALDARRAPNARDAESFMMSRGYSVEEEVRPVLHWTAAVLKTRRPCVASPGSVPIATPARAAHFALR